MKTALHILKIGGHLVNDSDALEEVLTAFTDLEGAKLLVHGGGRHATALAKQLGISPKMVDGRRITDAVMLEVAVSIGAWLMSSFTHSSMLSTEQIFVSRSSSSSTIVAQFSARSIFSISLLCLSISVSILDDSGPVLDS